MNDSGLVQVTRVDLPGGTEIHLAARPGPGVLGSSAQIDAAYDALRGALQAHGVAPGEVITERIFLRDLATQAADARAAARRLYGAAPDGGAGGPATTLLEQPPARSGQAIEIQAMAIVAGPGGAPRHEAATGLPPGASGRIARADGTARLHLAGITGGTAGDALGFRSQADALFARAEASLAAQRFEFSQVARTWLFLADIDHDYAALNQARRDFVAARALAKLPASTGIAGRPQPPDRRVALDLVAWDGPGVLGLRPFSAPTMNEAPVYGSDFSRGMRVDLDRRAILYVSGTASIDGGGQVVHPGDPARQARRMLLNVEQLLAGQGAGLGAVVSVVTYLKRAADHDAVLAVAHDAGLPAAIPHTICVADICRPEWLCEIEAVAVVG